jgi:hypothetical protein
LNKSGPFASFFGMNHSRGPSVGAVVVVAILAAVPELRAEDHKIPRSALKGFRFSVAEPDASQSTRTATQRNEKQTAHEVVEMEKVVVSDAPAHNYIPVRVEMRSTKPEKKRHRWGTGVHEKDFGKVRAYSVTILYIPILVGLSW